MPETGFRKNLNGSAWHLARETRSGLAVLLTEAGFALEEAAEREP